MALVVRAAPVPANADIPIAPNREVAVIAGRATALYVLAILLIVFPACGPANNSVP